MNVISKPAMHGYSGPNTVHWPATDSGFSIVVIRYVMFRYRQFDPTVLSMDKRTIDEIVDRYAATKGWRPSKMKDDPELTRVRATFRLLLSNNRPTPIDDPVFLNADLCGTGGRFMWRTGVPGDMRWLPKVEVTRKLYRLWIRRFHDEFQKKIGTSNREKYKFCVWQYAILTALKPYRYGNTRTAIGLYYDIQRAFGMPVCVLTGDTFGAFQRKVERLQRRFIRPVLQNRGFLLE